MYTLFSSMIFLQKNTQFYTRSVTLKFHINIRNFMRMTEARFFVHSIFFHPTTEMSDLYHRRCLFGFLFVDTYFSLCCSCVNTTTVVLLFFFGYIFGVCAKTDGETVREMKLSLHPSHFRSPYISISMNGVQLKNALGFPHARAVNEG